MEARIHAGRAMWVDDEGVNHPAVPASGRRPERAVVETAAIRERLDPAREGRPADIRDVLGGPDPPLRLDDAGGTVDRKSGLDLLPEGRPQPAEDVSQAEEDRA